MVHPEIEVAEAEDDGLEPLCVVECLPTVLEALVDGSRYQHHVLGVAVASLVEH